MLAKKVITESLQNTTCPKCGASMGQARLITISEAASSLVAHAVCPVCKTESMLTITPHGSGVLPIYSDLIDEEFKKFILERPVSYDDLFDLHTILKKKNIWKLLQEKEKNSEKNQKA